MLFSSGLLFVTVSPFVRAVVLFTPSQTSPLAPSAFALSGWTPLPTTPSEVELVRRLLEDSQLTTDCAYFEDIPLTCPPNQYCAYDNTESAVGCCSVDSNGNFLANCVVPTACLNQAESSLSCPTSGCPGGTAVCGGDLNYPECVTYQIDASLDSYVMFYCGTTETEATASLTLAVTVLETSYQNPLPPSTLSSSSNLGSVSTILFASASSSTSAPLVSSNRGSTKTTSVASIPSSTSAPLVSSNQGSANTLSVASLPSSTSTPLASSNKGSASTLSVASISSSTSPPRVSSNTASRPLHVCMVQVLGSLGTLVLALLG